MTAIAEYVLTQDIRLRILTGEKADGVREQMHRKGMNYMHDQAQKEYDWITYRHSDDGG